MKSFEFTLKSKKKDKVDTLNVSFPEEKVHLWELVSSFGKLYNKIISLEMEGEEVSCRKGCSACCCQLVPLSAPEAFYFVKKLETLEEDHKNRILKRIRKYKNKIHQAGFHEGQNVPTDRDYFQLGLPCPLLEDHNCSLYNFRPFVCRQYNVRSSPKMCDDPYENEIKRIALACHMGVLMSALASALWGVDAGPIPLIYATEFVERNKAWELFKFPGLWTVDKMMNGVKAVLKDRIEIEISPPLS